MSKTVIGGSARPLFEGAAAFAGPAGELALKSLAASTLDTDAASPASGAARSAASFRAILASVSHHPLSGLYAELESLGRRLAHERSLALFYRYKALVQRFVAQALEGYVLTVETTCNAGRMRAVRLVRLIDRALEDVLRALLDASHDELAVLSAVGELEGLLIDVLV